MRTSDPRVKEFRDSYSERNHVSALRVLGDERKAQKREENWEALFGANRDQTVEVLRRLHDAYWKRMREADIIAAENPELAHCENTVRMIEARKMVRDWKRRRDASTGSARFYSEDNSRFERAKVFGLIALFVALAWGAIIWRLSH